MAEKAIQAREVVQGHCNEPGQEPVWHRRQITLKWGEGVARWGGERQGGQRGKGRSRGVAEIRKGQGEEMRLHAGGNREGPAFLCRKGMRIRQALKKILQVETGKRKGQMVESVTETPGGPLRPCAGWTLWELQRGHTRISKNHARCCRRMAVKQTE